MVDKQHLKVPRWLKFVSPVSFIVVLFLLVVSYQSFFDVEPPPVQTGPSSAAAKAGPLATVVTYSRQVTIDEDTVVTIYRTLACEGYSTFDFSETTRRYEEGSRTAHRTLVAPFRIQPGTKCQLLSGYSYKPTFSIPWHHVKVAPIPFVVEDLQ